MAPYDFSVKGYCAPIIQNLASFFTQNSNLNSSPGTLQALTSAANTRNRRLSISRPDGKNVMLFLEWMTQEHCFQGEDVGVSSSCSYDVCATGDEVNRKEGVFLDRDMLKCLQFTPEFGSPAQYPQLSMTYDYSPTSLHASVCSRSEAEEVTERMASYMWQYALALNKYLWTAMTADYTAHTSGSVPSDCIPYDAAGAGKGIWFDINGVEQSGIVNFTALTKDGAVFPRFHSDLQKMYMLNGMSNTPIIVHGYGALYDYNVFRRQSAFCCNDKGVDGDAIAGEVGGFYFLESRPRANNNTGVTQDDVLIWEAGNHQLIFDIDFNGPTKSINRPDYERRIVVDPRTNLPFYFIRKQSECNVHDTNTYNVIPAKFLLVSKPVEFDQCPGGSNQTICLNVSQCTPEDCAGNPAWGPMGDPTTDLSTVTVTRAVETLAQATGRTPEEMLASLKLGQESRSIEGEEGGGDPAAKKTVSKAKKTTSTAKNKEEGDK